jgi:hypothetical protein
MIRITMRAVKFCACSLMASLVTIGLPSSASAGSCEKEGAPISASSCGQKLSWTYNPATKSFSDGSGLPARSSGPTGPQYTYDYLTVCGGGSEGLSCGAAIYTCRPLTPGGPFGYRWQVLRTLLLPDGTKSTTPGVTSYICDYPSTPVKVADVEALARQQIEKAVGHPSITVSPPGLKTLVNIPTIFSAPDLKPVTLTITTPVPGTITATPDYSWDFDDGLTGVGPGTPYNPSVDPMKDPDNYLHAIYQTGGPKHIVATLTWDVTFLLQGTTPVDLAPIVAHPSVDIQVMTAKPRLYNP